MKVNIDFENKKATCEVDPEKFDSQAALAQLTAQDQFKETALVQ